MTLYEMVFVSKKRLETSQPQLYATVISTFMVGRVRLRDVGFKQHASNFRGETFQMRVMRRNPHCGPLKPCGEADLIEPFVCLQKLSARYSATLGSETWSVRGFGLDGSMFFCW